MAEPSGELRRTRRRFRRFRLGPRGTARLDAPAILATVYEDQSHVAAGAHKAWDYNVHFVFSQDLFKSPHERRLTCGNSFEVLSGRDVYVAQLSDCEAYHGASKEDKDAFEGTDVALRVSTDGGRNFKRACFPVGLRQRGFTIFDWNEGRDGADFIAVDHDEEDAAEAAAPMGNVYSSDASGQLYSISLRRNLYFGGAVDFINVEGIEGVYIANQIANDAFVSPEGVAGGSPEDFVKTRISFNGGGAWQPVKAPAVDVTGKPITCHSDDCELHLHGASHWQRGTWKTRLGSVYSQPSAPGVVLATGNVGEYLSGDAQIVNTFLSRDAGATWTEILKGPHIYEFGNHGGLIVVAKMAALGPTTKVQFSRDEGRSWEDVPPARDQRAQHPRRSRRRGDRLRHPRHRRGIHGGRRRREGTDLHPRLLQAERSLGEALDLRSMRRREGLRVVESRGAGRVQRVHPRQEVRDGASSTGRVLPERSRLRTHGDEGDAVRVR